MSLVLNKISGESSLKWTTVFSYTTSTFESPKFWLLNRKCFFRLNIYQYCKDRRTDYVTTFGIKNINASAHPDFFDMTTYIKTSSEEWAKTRLDMCNILHCFVTFMHTEWPAKVHPGPEEMTLEFVFHGDVGSTIRLAAEEDTASSSLTNTDRKMILLEDISKLQGKNFFHDLEIHCGEHTFKAHRNILSCRSEVFLAMLQSDMVEGQTARVNIKDMDLDVCKEFLKFLYTGELPELTQDIARGLYEAGDRYNVGGLMKSCTEFLTRNLADDNALEMLVLADSHSDAMLKENVMQYILDRELPLQDDIWKAFYDSQPKLSYEVLNRAYKTQHSK